MAEKEIVVQLRLEDRNAVARLGQLETETKKYQRDLRQLNAEILKNGTATRAQLEAVGELNARIRRNQSVIRELKNDLSGATAAGLRFRDKMAEASRAGLGAFGLSTLGVAGAVTGLVRVLQSAGTIVADFDKAQSNLASIVGTTKEGVIELTNAAKQYGASTIFTATQVSELQTELAKLGFTIDQIQDATPAILDLAAATGTTLANAAEIAAKTLNAFGLEANETQRIVDVIAESANRSALDIDTFAAAMSDAAPSAKAVGISVEEATAMLSALVDAGIPAAKAGTDLRTIFIKLAESGMTLDEAYAEIKGSQDKLTTSVGIFDVRAANSALILADNTQKLAELTEGYNSAAGAAAKMAEVQKDNLRGDQLLLQSAWEGFVLSVETGEGRIATAFRAITQATTDLILALTGDLPIQQFDDFYDSIIERAKIGRVEFIGLYSKIIEDNKGIVAAFKDDVDEATKIGGEAALDILEGRKIFLQEEINRMGKITTREEEARVRILEQLQSDLYDARERVILQNRASEAAQKNVNEVTEEAGSVTEETATKEEKRAKIIRILTDEMRAFLKAQQDIEQGVGIGQLDVVGGVGSQEPVPEPGDRLKGTDLASQQEEMHQRELERIKEVQDAQAIADQARQDALHNTFDLLTSLGQLAEEGSAEAKAIAISQAVVGAYLAIISALATFDAVPDPTGLVKLAKATAIGAAAFSAVARIRSAAGFEEGGYTPRKSSDSAPVGVVHANEYVVPAPIVRNPRFRPILDELEDARRRMGMGFGNGAYAVGGLVRGTALVNRETVPAGVIAQADLQRALNSVNFSPVVRVTDINSVQGAVRVQDQRSTL